MKKVNNNPATVMCTEKKSAFFLVTTGSVTNGGRGYKHWKSTNVHILVFSH
jgi:hypothetical protein